MISYWEGLPFPMEFHPGDLVFIAGRPPIDRTRRLPFEHVAFVAEHRTVTSDAEFLLLPVYGMPESRSRTWSVGVTLSNAMAWSENSAVGVQIGSSATDWNLAGRHDQIDARIARHIGFTLEQRAGSMQISYDRAFVVDSRLSRGLRTNCLGFVCSILEYFGFVLLAQNFPRYQSAYDMEPRERDFPSTGHLARALNLPQPKHPYRAANREEAEKYA